MIKNKILFVDDNDAYRTYLASKLEEHGYSVDQVDNAVDGMEKLSLNQYQLVISDLKMDAVDGIRFLKYVRTVTNNIKTVLLTAEPDDDSQIGALDIKVDQYITKDTSLPVLLKYIEVLLLESVDESENKVTPQKLYSPNDGVVVDLKKRVVLKDDQVVHVTPKEYAIICLLLSHANCSVGRDDILEKVWDNRNEIIEIRVIDTHIKMIRRKLQTHSIVNIRGFGYRWDV